MPSSRRACSAADALEPKVSTYHSFASGIVSDYGLRLGVERDVVLLGGAQAWQLASEVVEAFDGDYRHFKAAKSTLVKAVIQLAGECAEHLQEPADVEAWLMARLAEFEALPYVAGAKKNAPQAAAELAAMLRTRASVADMVGRYAAAKTRPGSPGLRRPGGARRPRGPGGSRWPPTWNASATKWCSWTNSRTRPTPSWCCFPGSSAAAMPSRPWVTPTSRSTASAGRPQASSSTSSGNSPSARRARRAGTGRRRSSRAHVLPHHGVAQRPGHPLRGQRDVRVPGPGGGAQGAGRHHPEAATDVPPLQPSPYAVDGQVVLGRFGTDVDEASALAEDVLKYRVTDFEREADGTPVPPALAVLCRRRAQMETIRREFEARGIPYEIVGLGGLLDTPEIVDLVATLRVLADPGRSDSLMRLLAGARWRIGPADLMAFRDWSSQLARRRGQPGRGDRLRMRDAGTAARRRRH